MNEATDLHLVEQTRLHGNKQAFGLLLERYQAGAQRMARRMVTHEETARELVQEAMLQAYLCLDSLERPERFESWLYGIVLNICRSYLRSRQDDPLSIEALAGGLEATNTLLVSHAPDPQTMAEMRELHELVRSSIATLSPQNQEAVLLFYYEQLSLREIGMLLGISVAAVKGRLHKSRRHLANFFTHYAAHELWTTAPSFAAPSSTGDANVERNESMVEVSIVDVIVVEEEKQAIGMQGAYIIILFDEAGQRLLPIWVGNAEGYGIAMYLLNNNPVSRPMTYDFTANLLRATGATLEEIQISALQSSTYYATARLRFGETIHEVDARPSDAIALALRMQSRITVAESILEQAGRVIPEKFRGQPQRKGLEKLAVQMEESKREYEAKMAEFKLAREQEAGQASDRLFTYVFGEAA